MSGAASGVLSIVLATTLLTTESIEITGGIAVTKHSAGPLGPSNSMPPWRCGRWTVRDRDLAMRDLLRSPTRNGDPRIANPTSQQQFNPSADNGL
jgi:hypothetical protein